MGIDFGATHTVAAVVDRGNYPVASSHWVDTWPSIIAANEAGELCFGLDAAAVRHEPGWSALRSFKRLLEKCSVRKEAVGPNTRRFLVDLGSYETVFFPFDPDLVDDQDLPRQAVCRRDDGPDVEDRHDLASA